MLTRVVVMLIVVEQSPVKVRVHLVKVDQVVEQKVEEEKDDDGARVEHEDEFYGGDHVCEGQQDYGRYGEHDVE